MKHSGFLSFGHWTPSPQSQTRSAADALSKRLAEVVQTRMADPGAGIAEPNRRAPRALAGPVRSEVAQPGPILKAAAAR